MVVMQMAIFGGWQRRVPGYVETGRGAYQEGGSESQSAALPILQTITQTITRAALTMLLIMHLPCPPLKKEGMALKSY